MAIKYAEKLNLTIGSGGTVSALHRVDRRLVSAVATRDPANTVESTVEPDVIFNTGPYVTAKGTVGQKIIVNCVGDMSPFGQLPTTEAAPTFPSSLAPEGAPQPAALSKRIKSPR